MSNHLIWLHPPFYLIVSGIGIAWGISEWVQSYFSGDFGTGADNRFSTAAIYIGIGLLYLTGASSLYIPPSLTFGPAALPLFVLGIASHAAGFWLRWLSIRTMGDSFSRKIQTSDGQKIITTGPFAYIRHPNYLAASLALGLGVYLYRIRIEEDFLRQHLTGYESYCREVTYRLVPLVY